MRGAGLEPAPGCPEGILSPPRLPFRHPRKPDVGRGTWEDPTSDQFGLDQQSPTSHIPRPTSGFQSGKRDSNPRPQPWQGCALPTELFPQLLIRSDQYSDLAAGLASLNENADVARAVKESLPKHAPHTTPNTPAILPKPHPFRSR